VSSKSKFQKDLVVKLMTTHDKHVFTNTINRFQDDFDTAIKTALAQHYEELARASDDYSKWLRSQAPVDYAIDDQGMAVRKKLQEVIPLLEEKAAELKGLVPSEAEHANDAAVLEFESYDDNAHLSIAALYEKMSKRKRVGDIGCGPWGRANDSKRSRRS
jgi:hypothetical protein